VQERDPYFLFCKCGDSSAHSSGCLSRNAVKEAPVDASSRKMQPPLGRKLPQQSGQESVMTQRVVKVRATADRSSLREF